MVSIFLFLSLFTSNLISQAYSPIVPEGNDFATAKMGDPWDMKELSDISIGLNNGGQDIHLDHIRVERGIFYSYSVTDDSQFYPLWPMFPVGKTGKQFPIPSNEYSCLFIGLKIHKQNVKSHNLQVFWFENESLNLGNFGQTKFIDVPDDEWRVVKINLSLEWLSGKRWTEIPYWAGLRIDPTTQKDANIEVDWVRLTNCKGVFYEIDNLPSSLSKFYLIKDERKIFVENISSLNGVGKIDLQGVEPGNYSYVVENSNGGIISQGSIIINQSPIVKISRPSPTSGPSIAWNMSSLSDVLKTECVEEVSITNGEELRFKTAPLACQNGGVSDPKIFLRIRDKIISSDYRFLSYRLFTEWSKPWANVPKGMIVRWIWSTQGTSFRDGYRCHWVSQDLPFDVGWQVYNVDLFDQFLGSPEQKAGECPLIQRNWQEAGEIFELRFDPNENITDEYFLQKIDWIMLSGVEIVKSGSIFSVYYSIIDESPDSVQIEFFYTSDPKNEPLQKKALPVTQPPPDLPPHYLYVTYLPLILNNTRGFYGMSFDWNTTGVSPSNYYLCAKGDDGLNQGIYCSTAPLRINP
ncbi:MAG: hypothetical protein ACOYXO_18040 [Chloroflexota bacterium]